MAARDDEVLFPRGPAPDPAQAQDLAEFLELLRQLRVWAGNPGYKRMEHAAGPGRLSKATLHRVFTGAQDLAFMRQPEQFVEATVTVLGAPAQPWLDTLHRLLRELHPGPLAPAPATASSSPRRWWRTRRAWGATAAVLVIAAAIGWIVTDQDRTGPGPITIDYGRPLTITAASSPLVLAVDEQSHADGVPAVLVEPGSRPHTWDFVGAHPDNPTYRQLRPTGPLLMCLDVSGSGIDDDTPVHQWGCLGANNQYWAPRLTPAGRVQLLNLHSGKCLATSASEPQAGMRLVQRTCADHPAQQWLLSPAAPAGAPASGGAPSPATTGQAGPDPAEYPAGGKDRPCDPGPAALDPAVTWAETDPARQLIRDEDPQRGQITLGRAAAAQLIRANRLGDTGTPETFYWAETWTALTPERFEAALQWTTLPGPGGWHTCALSLTTHHEVHKRYATRALPRMRAGKKVWFRTCLTYLPENRTTRHTDCTGRY